MEVKNKKEKDAHRKFVASEELELYENEIEKLWIHPPETKRRASIVWE